MGMYELIMVIFYTICETKYRYGRHMYFLYVFKIGLNTNILNHFRCDRYLVIVLEV